jgi:cAMP-dependent protein kinase regulator
VAVLKRDGTTETRIAELGSGRTFGEIGLLKGIPRTASVVAESDVHVLRVARQNFLDWIALTDLLGDELGALLHKEYMQRAILQAIPSINRTQLADRAAGFQLRRFPVGTTLIRKGDLADTFFVLTHGTVTILKDPGGPRGEASEPTAIEMHAGSFFGELGILNRQPRSATVVTTTDVEVVTLRAEDFLQILRESGRAKEEVAMTICRRLLDNL